ncbi:50S ribosomal protein L18 [Candidatus Parvarchaeota archaeon]|nr:50S ribosomal protein L18 [Candidatus Parvarchaeota archaeon]
MKSKHTGTNYRKRVRLLKSGLPRLVVRKTNSMVIGQLVEYSLTGDKTIASVHGSDLAKYGWSFGFKNSSACYMAGFLLGKKTGGREAILDNGHRTMKKDSFIYFFVRGAKDAGMKVRSGELPVTEGRIFGEHIANHYSKRTGNQFSALGEKVNNIKAEMDKTLEKLNSYGK